MAQVHTGVQRYAAETLLALDALLAAQPELAARWQFELAMPDGARPLPLACIRSVHLPGGSSHLWEQWPLLRHSRGAFLVNFNYSGPLLKRRQLITIHDATTPSPLTRIHTGSGTWHEEQMGRGCQSHLAQAPQR